MTNTKNGVFLNFTEQELAIKLAHNLRPLIEQQVNRILELKSEDEDSPLKMAEAINFLGLSRTTFSKILAKGEIPFKSLNLDNPKAKKFFLKKDLREWLQKNRTITINELKMASNGKTQS